MTLNPWRRQEPLDHSELARLLPAPGDPALPYDRQLLLEEQLMQEIQQHNSAAAPATLRRSRRRLVYFAAPGALVALAGGAIAATTLIGSSAASVRNEVRCYSVGRLADNTHQYTDTTVASTAGQARPNNAAKVSTALDSCSALWRIGLIQPGKIVTDIASTPGDRPVPNLVACVLTSGEAAVLPGDGHTCQTLALPELTDRK